MGAARFSIRACTRCTARRMLRSTPQTSDRPIPAILCVGGLFQEAPADDPGRDELQHQFSKLFPVQVEGRDAGRQGAEGPYPLRLGRSRPVPRRQQPPGFGQAMSQVFCLGTGRRLPQHLWLGISGGPELAASSGVRRRSWWQEGRTQCGRTTVQGRISPCFATTPRVCSCRFRHEQTGGQCLETKGAPGHRQNHVRARAGQFVESRPNFADSAHMCTRLRPNLDEPGQWPNFTEAGRR